MADSYAKPKTTLYMLTPNKIDRATGMYCILMVGGGGPGPVGLGSGLGGNQGGGWTALEP